MFSARVKVPVAGALVSAIGVVEVPAIGVGTGLISGSTLATFAGLKSEVVTPAGVGTMVTGGSTVASARLLTGLTCATGVEAGAVLASVLVGDGLADADADAAAATATVWDAAGRMVMAGLVAAPAVAVSVTAVTGVALAATAIWACIWYAVGDSDVASDPIVHVADPLPFGQRLVNTALWPCGDAASVTDTPDAEPFWVDTWTVNDAA
jgi:hypothetical protein